MFESLKVVLIKMVAILMMSGKLATLGLIQQNSADQKILFPLGRKSVCTSRVKDIDKCVSTIRKSCCHFKKYLKKLKKLVSTSRNMVCLKIIFPLISIILATYRKKLGIKQLTLKKNKATDKKIIIIKKR